MTKISVRQTIMYSLNFDSNARYSAPPVAIGAARRTMFADMNKIEAVETAKAVMNEGKDWSILKWLTEKKRVRRIADTGTEALNEAERAIKATWPESLRDAYAALAPADVEDDPYAAAEFEFAKQKAAGVSESVVALARRVKDADEIATKARNDAEKGFSDAERRMSASMARAAAEMAIEAYEVRYKALAEAEAARDACAGAAARKNG